MTATSTTPQRYQKKPITAEVSTTPDMAALRAEAKALGINSYGLGKQALAASISAVKGALGKEEPLMTVAAIQLSAGANGRAVSDPEDPPAETADAPRTDDTGEPLGPNAIKRVSLGSHQLRLGGDPIPGFYCRWINDVYGRIDRAKKAGYTHVTDPQGSPMYRPVGARDEGGGLRAYYMKLPQHLRDEDNAARAAVNDEIDGAIKRGKYKTDPEDKNYIPDQGIKIERR
jgi:hypothetical protein